VGTGDRCAVAIENPSDDAPRLLGPAGVAVVRSNAQLRNAVATPNLLIEGSERMGRWVAVDYRCFEVR
jgi:hypothetical protein